MTKLSVSLDVVAFARNQPNVDYPGLIEVARRVVSAGAHGITVHPRRPDGHQIRADDVRDLTRFIASECESSVEINVEGNPFASAFALAKDARPTQATLVPDAPHAATSNAGWDLVRHGEALKPIIASLKKVRIRVSLLIDPVPAVVRYARQLGADRIELHTGRYGAAFATAERDKVIHDYVLAAQAARSVGLGVNAGRDLSMANTRFLCAMIPWLDEVSIGHAMTSDALEVGLEAAVKGYLASLSGTAWP